MQKIKVVVYHGAYGCDTGCCGHYVELKNDENHARFFFTHPYGRELQPWALQLAQEVVTEKYGADHVADLDWENCIISDD